MSISSIRRVWAKEILTSGGFPSIEAYVETDAGIIGSASLPFGASAGKHEAHILLDGGKRFCGQGMLKAIKNIETIIAPALQGIAITAQPEIDAEMLRLDGTANKSRLGGNAILAVSLACARAAAVSEQLPLYAYLRHLMKWETKAYSMPTPLMVLLEGGVHADNSADIQEYLIAPCAKKRVAENIRIGIEVFHALKSVLKKAKRNTNVGNEGAYAPEGIKNNTEPFTYLKKAVEVAGYTYNKDVKVGIDAAASEFFRGQKYHLTKEKKTLSGTALAKMYMLWQKKFDLFYMEDCFAEDDFKNWKFFEGGVGAKFLNVGDDLTVTNPKRLQQAVEQKLINGVIIKPNQIGTLTETLITIGYAKQKQLKTIVSHRGGGETNDAFIVDLAVSVNADLLKVGPSRGERIAKYNRLMEIEQEIIQKK